LYSLSYKKVGGLSSQANERDLKSYFTKCGNVVKVEIKGLYGFVTYESEREAKDAERQLHNSDFMGKKLNIEMAKGPRRDRQQQPVQRTGRSGRTEYRVIVENISSSTTWQALKDYFRKAGEVVFTNVEKDRSKPYGYVFFLLQVFDQV